MFKEKAIALLKIHPEEARMAFLVAALFLCVQAGQGFGENAAFALFLSRLNVDRLPYMYMGLGVVVFLATMAFSASLGRFQNASVVVYLLAGSAVLFIVEWIAIAFLSISIYTLLWLTTYGMSVILGTLLWTVAGEVCDARQAKRLFPFFTSVGILGSVLGNTLTGVIAGAFTTNSLIVLYALLLGCAFFLAREITRAYFKPEPLNQASYNFIQDLRAGLDFVRHSGLFRLVAYSSILFSVLFFTIDFPFNEIVSVRFANNEAGLAGFKGLFTSVTTAVTFFVSLLLANRLYTRLGIVNSILIMPVTYIIGFIVFFISFQFEGAVIVRLAQLVVLGGVMGTAWSALFNVVPLERRGQVLAFTNGVPAQIGVILSGLLLVASKQFFTTQQVLLMGAMAANRISRGLARDGLHGGSDHRVLRLEHVVQSHFRNAAVHHLIGHIGNQFFGQIDVGHVDFICPVPMRPLRACQQRDVAGTTLRFGPGPVKATLHGGGTAAVRHYHEIAHCRNFNVGRRITVGAQAHPIPSQVVAGTKNLARHPFGQFTGSNQRGHLSSPLGRIGKSVYQNTVRWRHFVTVGQCWLLLRVGLQQALGGPLVGARALQRLWPDPGV